MKAPRKEQPAPGAGPAVETSFHFENRIYELRRNSCGKKNCATCEGVRPAHGPYWYMCISRRGKWTRIYIGKDLDTTKFVNEDGTITPPNGRTLRPEQVAPPGAAVDEPGQTHLVDLEPATASVLWTCPHCAQPVYEDSAAHTLLTLRQRCPVCSRAADVSLVPPRLPAP